MDPLYSLFFVASGCSASVCRSSLVGNMKINFAPLDLPLQRRLQTAAVLQWVFSFLGLGEFSFHCTCPLETCVNGVMVGWYSLCRTKSAVIPCLITVGLHNTLNMKSVLNMTAGETLSQVT